MLGDIPAELPIRLSLAGEVAEEQWLWLQTHFPRVELDAWEIIPNHIHGILLLSDVSHLGFRQKPLGQLIGAFKTTSAKRVNQIRGTPGWPVWQRDYFDHVIRGSHSLERIRRYIGLNPSRWVDDKHNPNRYRRTG